MVKKYDRQYFLQGQRYNTILHNFKLKRYFDPDEY